MVTGRISRSERWASFVLQQVATKPPQRQETIHFLMVVASRTPCHACNHDGGGRVLDTQPSAGTLDTNTYLRLPAGTAARAKIKHPRSARAGCDRHTTVRKTCAILDRCYMSPRQMLSRCNPIQAIVHGVTQKLKFYIHCCSTCHAFPRSHMNLDIAPHALHTWHLDVRVLSDTAPDDTPDTIHAHQHTLCSSNNVPSCWNRCVRECVTSVTLERYMQCLSQASP